VKLLRSDNGAEYISLEFKESLASKDIEHQLTIPGWSEQNRVAERMNHTLKWRARNMRLQADMSEDFWAEAVSHASYLMNRLPSTVINF